MVEGKIDILLFGINCLPTVVAPTEGRERRPATCEDQYVLYCTVLYAGVPGKNRSPQQSHRLGTKLAYYSRTTLVTRFCGVFVVSACFPGFALLRVCVCVFAGAAT